MQNDTDLLEHLYDYFNTREIEAALAIMHPDVEWANGLDGGHVHGHDGVRDYWTRQWKSMDSLAKPISFSARADGALTAQVHLTAHDLNGKLLFDTTGEHIFWIENGLIRRFVIG
jgi:ketosteroid isomerase-like protein